MSEWCGVLLINGILQQGATTSGGTLWLGQRQLGNLKNGCLCFWDNNFIVDTALTRESRTLDDAEAAGTACNAMHGAPKVGVVGAALNEELINLKPGKDLLKFIIKAWISLLPTDLWLPTRPSWNSLSSVIEVRPQLFKNSGGFSPMLILFMARK